MYEDVRCCRAEVCLCPYGRDHDVQIGWVHKEVSAPRLPEFARLGVVECVCDTFPVGLCNVPGFCPDFIFQEENFYSKGEKSPQLQDNIWAEVWEWGYSVLVCVCSFCHAVAPIGLAVEYVGPWVFSILAVLAFHSSWCDSCLWRTYNLLFVTCRHTWVVCNHNPSPPLWRAVKWAITARSSLSHTESGSQALVKNWETAWSCLPQSFWIAAPTSGN